MKEFIPTFTDISDWNKKPYSSTGGTRSKNIYTDFFDIEYFFKGSKKLDDGTFKYPTEFWSEIVASKVGKWLGFDVLDLGLSTTPTVEIAVPDENAAGGIILTASHNPKQWNALKLLNEKGEFISAEDGAEVLALADKIEEIEYPEIDAIGSYRKDDTYIDKHIKKILDQYVYIKKKKAQGRSKGVFKSLEHLASFTPSQTT